MGPLLTSCLWKNKENHTNAHTTHEQTEIICFLTTVSNVQAINKARILQKRALCHQLNKRDKIDLPKSESACALQHHHSNVTTRALFTTAATELASLRGTPTLHAVATPFATILIFFGAFQPSLYLTNVLVPRAL